MSGIEIGALACAGMLLLMFLRVHIASAMLLAGAVGYLSLAGWDPLMNYFKSAAYARFSVYDLSVIPLFLLMGQFATKGGMSRALLRGAHALVGQLRGGLAMAGIGASAGFGAICGSSLATAATIGQTALPEFKKAGYHPRLSGAALAAGGTLGILIPPSVPLVLYAILTEQNIGKLFIAAFIPGFLAVLGYLIVISIVARRHPEWAPTTPSMPLKERARALIDTWQALVVFVLVIGGIYSGFFTTNEAAAVGVLATGAFAWLGGGLKNGVFWNCLMDTAKTTGMLFFILIGADMFNVFLALSGMPAALAETVTSWKLEPMLVLLAVLVLYVLLGCVMDSISMLLLTMPIFFPMLMGLDFYGLTETQKAIWFGVIALSTVEMGLITPPVGMNVYVISSLSKDVPMSEVFKGIFPFLISDVVRIGLMLAFPAIVLYLL